MQNTETLRFPIDVGTLWRTATTITLNPLSPTPSRTSKQAAVFGPARRFVFETAAMPEGRKVLFFPFASISDVHWGTRACRAKRFAHMMYHVESAELHAVGDIVDLKHLAKKKSWHIGPWHRQGIAHIVRKAASGTKTLYYRGNHETGMRDIEEHRAGTPAPIWRSGRELMGVKLVYDHERIDPQGRSQYIIHGDIYDYGAFESEKLAGLMKLLTRVMGSKKNAESFIYNFCNGAYESLYSVDSLLQSLPGLEHASLAAEAKKLFKEYINERLDIRRVISEALDNSPHQVMIYGHSHMPGFEWTPGGKLLVNDGCSTEHVNMLAQDRNGTLAILTWHKNGMEVEEEPSERFGPGVKYFVSWKELGLDHFSAPVKSAEDSYTAAADRLLRLAYRLAPPRERVEIKERIMRQQDMLDTFDIAVGLGYQPRAEEIMAYHRMTTEHEQERDKMRRMDAALPRPALPRLSLPAAIDHNNISYGEYF